MLQVTSAAMSTFDEARQGQDVPDDAGVRIYAQRDEQGEVGIALAFAQEPEADDQVTSTDGTDVYIAPELAEPLSDSVLDIRETDEGKELVISNPDDPGA